MKIEFTENKHHAHFNLVPETPQEMAQLLRVTKSSKKQTPRISMYFDDDKPVLNISIKKLDEKKQENYLNNE